MKEIILGGNKLANGLIVKKYPIYVYDGDLHEMQSIRNAISIYYLKDQGKDNGINSVSSDSLFIYFADNKPKNIIAKGGVEGTFYPPDYKGIIKNDY